MGFGYGHGHWRGQVRRAAGGAPTPTPGPTLAALALDDTSVPEDSAATINITGATSGSTITVQSGALPAGMTLNSGARTIAGTPTTAETASFTLRETLGGATNSPRDTALSITVTDVVVPITPPVLTLTSAAGASPLTWDTTLDMDDTSAGDYLRVQVDDTSSAFGSITQDITHLLTGDEIAEADIDLTSDGFETPSGLYFLRARVERDDDSTSDWSNVLTDTISGGGGGNSHAYRYYQLQITEVNANEGVNVVAFVEVEIAATVGGTDTTSAATPSVSSTLGGGYGAPEAIDNNTETICCSAVPVSVPWTLTLDYSATEGNWIAANQFKITARSDGAYQAPYTGKWRGSDDASTWTDLSSFTALAFAEGETKTFTV